MEKGEYGLYHTGKMKDKISVVVPVYNVEKYLSKCIDSIMHQSFENLEIILVDDGSKDNSGKICDKYAKEYTNIKVIHQENKGLSMARNTGIEMATGEYIGFVDSDDYIDAKMYEVLYKNIIKYNADISICKYEKVNEIEIKEDIKGDINNEEVLVMSNVEAIKELLSAQEKISNHAVTKLYKKRLFENIKYPEKRKFEDIGTTYYLFEKSKKVVFINYIGYKYLQRNDSITGKARIEDIKDEMYMVKKRYDYLFQKYPNLQKELLMNRAYFALIYHVNYARLGEKNIYYKSDIMEEYNFYKEYIKRYSIKDILKINKMPYKFFAILLEFTNRNIFFNLCYILYKLKK